MLVGKGLRRIRGVGIWAREVRIVLCAIPNRSTLPQWGRGSFHTIHLHSGILGLDSGCEIFDEAGAMVSGHRRGIIDGWVVCEVVSNGASGGAGRAGNASHERRTVEKSEN